MPHSACTSLTVEIVVAISQQGVVREKLNASTVPVVVGAAEALAASLEVSSAPARRSLRSAELPGSTQSVCSSCVTEYPRVRRGRRRSCVAARGHTRSHGASRGRAAARASLSLNAAQPTALAQRTRIGNAGSSFPSLFLKKNCLKCVLLP